MNTMLFTPISIGPVELPNRIAVPPMAMYSARSGVVQLFHKMHYGHLAASGAGQQKKRPLCRHDAFALHIVERREPGSDHCAARGQKSGFKCCIHSFTFSKTTDILPHFSPFVDIKKTFEAAAALSFRSG